MKTLLAILILILFTGVNSLAQYDPDPTDEIPVISAIHVKYISQDNRWYTVCTLGCDEFYTIAPIVVLFAGSDTEFEEINRYGQLLATYRGRPFYPIPMPIYGTN